MSAKARPERQRHPHMMADGRMGLVCHGCEVEQDLSMFTKRSRTKSGYDSYCKECQKWRMKLVNYGITKRQYMMMLAKQNHRCAICECDASSTRCTHGHFAVDHCHTTGQVRGLLCDHCNQAIGRARDDYALLGKMIWYLQSSRKEFALRSAAARPEVLP